MRRVSERRLSLLVGLALTLIFVSAGLSRLDAVSREAVVYEAACDQLLAKTTEGRQALVSSAWWPPVPVLLRLPVAWVDTSGLPIASIVVAALFGAGAVLLLDRMLRYWQVGRSRYLLLLALLLSPSFLVSCTNGSTDTTVLFLALLGAYGLVHWVRERRLRYLVSLGMTAAVLAGMSLDVGAWLLFVFLLVIVDQFVSRGRWREKEAVLLLAFVPALYAVLLWMLMNWLIMGDALYFLRALMAPRPEMVPCATQPASLGLHLFAAVALLLFLLFVAPFRHCRAGAYLAALGLGFAALSLFLQARGLLWPESPLLGCVFPFSVAATGYVGGRLLAFRGRERFGLACLPLLIAALLWAERAADPGRYAGKERYADVVEERNALLPRIEGHVLRRSRYVRVFVCGYDSFALLGPAPRGVFLHSLDFNFHKAKNDYPGHILYVLIRCPHGRSAMDSIHWSYDRIYDFGSRSTLYDGTWGKWRLFEIIQAPLRRSGDL